MFKAVYVLERDAGERRWIESVLASQTRTLVYLDDATAFIHARPRPLALYCFSHDAAERDELLRRTHSGGVTVNDWGWHAINHDAPFGGIGNSGIGDYHGEEGFRELSHACTVFQRRRGFPTQLFHPPYGNFVQKLVLKFFLGEADPSLGGKPGH